MSSSIGPILMTQLVINNMNKTTGGSSGPEKPDQKDVDFAISAMFLMLIFTILAIGLFTLTQTQSSSKTAQIHGVGYYAVEYSGKYNTLEFLGDTSIISKDSAIILMKPYAERGGEWFLEVKDYFKQVEKVEKLPITSNDSHHYDTTSFYCKGDKFVEYRCKE